MQILSPSVKHRLYWTGRSLSGVWLCFALATALTPMLRAQSAPTHPAPSQPAAPPSAQPKEKTASAAYRIALDDVIEITVLEHADLTKVVTVPPDGIIDYPFIGEIKAAGLSLSELRQRITTVLSSQLARPRVTVTLRSVHAQPVRYVSVLGAVKSPGKRAFVPGWRLLDLIVDCGGTTAARPEFVTATLVRANQETIPVDLAWLLTSATPAVNLPLMPGDVLLVNEVDPSKTQVQVAGEVVHPGAVAISKDGSPVAVLNLAGGPTPHAALSKAMIRRGPKTILVDLSSVVIGIPMLDKVRMEPGDVLFIPRIQIHYYVGGAVGKPGFQDYPEGRTVTVLSALSEAGGQTADTSLNGVTLSHIAPNGKMASVTLNLEKAIRQGDLSKDLPLHPGDVVYFPSRKRGGGFRWLDALPFLGLLGL